MKADDERTAPAETEETTPTPPNSCRMACPVCGGKLIEIRAKLQCSQCHSIIETCCEGGPES